MCACFRFIAFFPFHSSISCSLPPIRNVALFFLLRYFCMMFNVHAMRPSRCVYVNSITTTQPFGMTFSNIHSILSLFDLALTTLYCHCASILNYFFFYFVLLCCMAFRIHFFRSLALNIERVYDYIIFIAIQNRNYMDARLRINKRTAR